MVIIIFRLSEVIGQNGMYTLMMVPLWPTSDPNTRPEVINIYSLYLTKIHGRRLYTIIYSGMVTYY